MTSPKTPLDQDVENLAYSLSEEKLLEIFDGFIESVSPITAKNHHLLHCFCEKEYTEILKKIIEKDQTPSVDLSEFSLDFVFDASKGSLGVIKLFLEKAPSLGWETKDRHLNQYLKMALLQNMPDEVRFIMSSKTLQKHATFFDLEESGESCYTLSANIKDISLLKQMVNSHECFLSDHWDMCPLGRSLRYGNTDAAEFWIAQFDSWNIHEKMAAAFINNKSSLLARPLFVTGNHLSMMNRLDEAVANCSRDARRFLAENLDGLVEIFPSLVAAREKEFLLKSIEKEGHPTKPPRQL